MAKVVLVTGVSRYLGGLFARTLSADPTIEKVIGVDLIPPPHDLGRTDFVRADIRNPMIGKVIADAAVDTVVHMNVIATPTSAGGRAPQKEINVIGTMQLLAACQKAGSVRRLVVKSSAAVYGSTPRDPALFTEDMAAKRLPTSGFGKDSIEVEGYVRGFARRRPDIEIMMLRFANIIGPHIRTTMTDYFGLPVIPVPLGFDARLQFMHEEDAVGALLAATRSPATGLINLAGDGIVTLLQAAALTGKPYAVMPAQAAGLVGILARRLGIADFTPDQVSLLAHGRGLDTTRMREVLGFEPRFTTRTAFEDYVDSLGTSGLSLDLIPAAVTTAFGAAASKTAQLRGGAR